jgi:hypothetical protein
MSHISARVRDFDFTPAFWDSSPNGYGERVVGLLKSIPFSVPAEPPLVSNFDLSEH